MNKILFTKMNGAGNDFIVIDKNLHPGIVLSNFVIKKLCNRHYGIGADGLIIISKSLKKDFEMLYYNADGSTGSLCGNGARCAIKFAFDNGLINQNLTSFISNQVEYSGEVFNDNKFKLNFNAPENLKLDIELITEMIKVKADFIDTGSPHVVINIENAFKSNIDNPSSTNELNDFPVYKIGKEIRYLSEFEPSGTNVNFIKIVNGKVYIRTYERGVEDETLACGTGSVASALISYFNHKLTPPIYLITKGGDELKVDFKYINNKFENLSLTGPAEEIFKGEYILNIKI